MTCSTSVNQCLGVRFSRFAWGVGLAILALAVLGQRFADTAPEPVVWRVAADMPGEVWCIAWASGVHKTVDPSAEQRVFTPAMENAE